MSWSSPFARSACRNPSWFVHWAAPGSSSSWASVGGGLRNRRRWRRSPRSYAKQQITNCPRRPPGEPASRSAEPARRGRRLPANAGRLRLHPGGARQPDQTLTTADLQHHPSASAAADCAAARCRRGDQRRAREGAVHRGSGQSGAPRPARRGRGAFGAGGGGTRDGGRVRIGLLGDRVSRRWSHQSQRPRRPAFRPL